MAAVHCIIDDNDRIIIDPDFISDDTLAFSRVQKPKRHSTNCKADFTFVFESLKESVISTHTNGSFTIQQFNQALALSRQASRKVFEFYTDLVKKYANVI